MVGINIGVCQLGFHRALLFKHGGKLAFKGLIAALQGLQLLVQGVAPVGLLPLDAFLLIARKGLRQRHLGLLAKSGYIAPEIVNGVTVAAEQTAAVRGAITFGFVGLEAITGIILAVLLIFLNVEKNIDKEQAEIKARREAEK